MPCEKVISLPFTRHKFLFWTLTAYRAPVAEKYFQEAATGHVHWRTLAAVAERFLEVGCSLISSLHCPHHHLSSHMGRNNYLLPTPFPLSFFSRFLLLVYNTDFLDDPQVWTRLQDSGDHGHGRPGGRHWHHRKYRCAEILVIFG